MRIVVKWLYRRVGKSVGSRVVVVVSKEASAMSEGRQRVQSCLELGNGLAGL